MHGRFVFVAFLCNLCNCALWSRHSFQSVITMMWKRWFRYVQQCVSVYLCWRQCCVGCEPLVPGWRGAYVRWRSKTAISRERLGARGWPGARCRAGDQGDATAAAERPRAAYLRRYAQNAEARPHGHLEWRGDVRRWLVGRAHEASMRAHLLAACGGRWEQARAEERGRERCGSLWGEIIQNFGKYGRRGAGARQVAPLRWCSGHSSSACKRDPGSSPGRPRP